MKINTSFLNLESSQSLQDEVDKKFASIGHMIQGFEKEGEMEMYIEIARTTHHHHKGEVYKVAIQLQLPKKLMQVEEAGEELRGVLDAAKDTLRGAVERYKEKMVEEKHR